MIKWNGGWFLKRFIFLLKEDFLSKVNKNLRILFKEEKDKW